MLGKLYLSRSDVNLDFVCQKRPHHQLPWRDNGHREVLVRPKQLVSTGRTSLRAADFDLFWALLIRHNSRSGGSLPRFSSGHDHH